MSRLTGRPTRAAGQGSVVADLDVGVTDGDVAAVFQLFADRVERRAGHPKHHRQGALGYSDLSVDALVEQQN